MLQLQQCTGRTIKCARQLQHHIRLSKTRMQLLLLCCMRFPESFARTAMASDLSSRRKARKGMQNYTHRKTAWFYNRSTTDYTSQNVTNDEAINMSNKNKTTLDKGHRYSHACHQKTGPSHDPDVHTRSYLIGNGFSVALPQHENVLLLHQRFRHLLALLANLGNTKTPHEETDEKEKPV